MAAADFRSTIRTTITPFFSKHIPSTTRHSHYSFSSTYSPKPLLSHHHRLTMPPVAIDGKQTVDVDVDDSCSSSVTVKPPSLHDYHRFDQQLLDNVAYDALVWASLHGLVMGDKSSKVLPLFRNSNMQLLSIRICIFWSKLFSC